jgi:hypothetical protein
MFKINEIYGKFQPIKKLNESTLRTGIFCGVLTIWCWCRHGKGQQAQAKQDQHRAADDDERLQLLTWDKCISVFIGVTN